jgi:hypothetical protein
MRIQILRSIPGLLIVGSGLFLTACAEQSYGPGPAHVQGHMVSALNYLNQANNELNQASHDKGGHRVNAIGLVNQAISEVNAGIAVGESHGD